MAVLYGTRVRRTVPRTRFQPDALQTGLGGVTVITVKATTNERKCFFYTPDLFTVATGDGVCKNAKLIRTKGIPKENLENVCFVINICMYF